MIGFDDLGRAGLSSRRRLIIVDDEPVILRLLTSVFDDEEYEVVSCPDGASAIRAMEEGGVDVLLTDKNLPDIGGLELLKRARAIQDDAECIIITGYASLDTVLAAMQLHAFDYIVKPPKDIFDVQRKVRQAFTKLDMGRENKRLLADLRARNVQLEEALGELRETQAELIQSEKLAGIGTLAAGVAHEISSPLFGVMGLAEAILDEEELPIIYGHAREIVEYSQAIKEIVVQLSGYSRPSTSEYHAGVDLRRAVEDAVRLVTRSLGAEAHEVRVEGADDVQVHARASEIQQIFVNLVKNALEAVADAHPTGGGEVVVELMRVGRWAQVVVRDNGPGIPEDRLHSIFDPFFTTKPPGRGTGLGLNIVYRLVTRYQGTVTVESQPSGGSRFVVRFPVEPG